MPTKQAMTSMTVFLRGHLEAMRTLERRNSHWASRARALDDEQHKWMLQMHSAAIVLWMKKAKHITLDVRIFRRVLIKDDDNLRYSFNKSVIDPLKRVGAIKDDSMKYLTIRTIGQCKCPASDEGIEITIERS